MHLCFKANDNVRELVLKMISGLVKHYGPNSFLPVHDRGTLETLMAWS
jgi:hypothetical protein